MSTLHPTSGPLPMDSYMESWVALCVTACVSQSPYFCSYTLFRMCTSISTWIYVQLAAYVWSTPLSIVWWKPGCPCMTVCLCASHLISVATPCLECVHASVHEFMSTLHPMSGPPHMDSYMVSWVALCVMHVCPSHLIVSPTPCLDCVHASVHEFMSTLHPMSGPPPMDSYMESWVALCVTLSMSHSPWLWSHTLFRMCTCISTWIYVHLAAYVWSSPYA